MAEIAGLVIGGLGLATLFSSVIGLCECVRFGKSFGQDYETALTRLSIIKLRLSRWAAAIQDQDEDFTTSEDGQHASKILERIKHLFEEMQKLSLRYPGSVALYDPLGDTGNEVRNLVSAITKIVKQRQKRAGLFRKTVWAVYDKEKFKELLDEVTSLVDGLVGLFPSEKHPGFVQKQECLCDEDLDVLTSRSKTKLSTLADAASGADQALGSRIEMRLGITKHLYFKNKISGRAKVKFGNEYLKGSKMEMPMVTSGNIYKDNVISGEAFIHFGDTFGGSSFLETTVFTGGQFGHRFN
ncbi:hypothetical protein TWF694_005853 [Orbilia ellipsospora]|uniref:Prion-inhibition and propagation HeLo domain-containing protein n=1 Tax=Orbilia ellipsospora TaxID=2528407 RepID=A0AAV9WY70_9PEZI